MRGFVAPTDYGWYRFLQARSELTEVNFWRPSQDRFAALEPGELFFFKLKAPHDAIGGFGLFSHATPPLPVWQAWDVFGAANGAPDPPGLLARLRAAAKRPVTVDDWIVCIAINEPVFFPPDAWVSAPADWQREIVRGKGYDLSVGEGRRLYERCLDQAAALNAMTDWAADAIEAKRRGKPLVVRPRLGQSSFRLAVLDAYANRCAITGERSLPVVEASHIRPYAAGGEHAVPNGLPLRRDIHRLFDLGFVSVRPDMRFAVSRSLRDYWKNGRVYYELDGSALREPRSPADRPDAKALEWHYDEVFRR